MLKGGLVYNSKEDKTPVPLPYDCCSNTGCKIYLAQKIKKIRENRKMHDEIKKFLKEVVNQLDNRSIINYDNFFDSATEGLLTLINSEMEVLKQKADGYQELHQKLIETEMKLKAKTNNEELDRKIQILQAIITRIPVVEISMQGESVSENVNQMYKELRDGSADD